MWPTYEELKEVKDHKQYTLFIPLTGGYFRLVRNEDGENNIALDYIEGGYLSSINRRFQSNYCFSKLYKFNKKNYQGLFSLYKKMLTIFQKELKEYIYELNNA